MFPNKFSAFFDLTAPSIRFSFNVRVGAGTIKEDNSTRIIYSPEKNMGKFSKPPAAHHPPARTV